MHVSCLMKRSFAQVMVVTVVAEEATTKLATKNPAEIEMSEAEKAQDMSKRGVRTGNIGNTYCYR